MSSRHRNETRTAKFANGLDTMAIEKDSVEIGKGWKWIRIENLKYCKTTRRAIRQD